LSVAGEWLTTACGLTALSLEKEVGMAYHFRVVAGTSRTALVFGAAAIAGGLADGPASGQSSPFATPNYPTPEFPTCVVKEATDCRLPDGKPDLSGLWATPAPSLGQGAGNGADPFGGLASGDLFRLFPGPRELQGAFNFEIDGALYRESNVDSGDPWKPNLPQYKPEYWDQITDNEYNGNFLDPQQMCLPLGVPRMGPPQAIASWPGQPWVELYYADVNAFGIRVRMVPTDGRPHNPVTVASETWDGDPVGHWEGDTLVIETTGFTDSSWLHKNGYIHGFNMKVTERLTRTGNQLKWEATVEDPDYLLQPWNLTPITEKLATDPSATLYEALPCMDNDNQHTTSHIRSG
jgi:hypothetical protein